MKEQENYSSQVWRVVAAMTMVVGVTFSLLLLLTANGYTWLIILFLAFIASLILLAIAQVMQMIVELPLMNSNQPLDIRDQSIKKGGSEVTNHWSMNDKEIQALHQYYESSGLTIDQFTLSPIKNYLAVIVGGNLDVVRVQGSEVQMLDKEEVESIPELHQWVEKHVLGK